MKNDVKLPNFTLCRTCEEFFWLFIYLNAVSCNLNSWKIRAHLSENVKWVVTIAMKFLKERKYFLLVMFSLTSSSLQRKIPVETDNPTLNPSIPSNRSLKELCHEIQPN